MVGTLKALSRQFSVPPGTNVVIKIGGLSQQKRVRNFFLAIDTGTLEFSDANFLNSAQIKEHELLAGVSITLDDAIEIENFLSYDFVWPGVQINGDFIIFTLNNPGAVAIKTLITIMLSDELKLTRQLEQGGSPGQMAARTAIIQQSQVEERG